MRWLIFVLTSMLIHTWDASASGGFKTVYEVEFTGVNTDSEGNTEKYGTYKQKFEATSEADVRVLLGRLFDQFNILSIRELK